MTRLRPVAFDIETTGFEPGATITVAGFANDLARWQVLNTGDRPASPTELQRAVPDGSAGGIEIEVVADEARLLEAVGRFVDERLDGDRQHLCAFNGETWRNGFDLPFLRTACAKQAVDWPFADLAYADVRSMIRRFNTGEAADLESAYTALIGDCQLDPFEDSEAAIDAFRGGDWVPLLRHNVADLIRTYELSVLAGRYVPRSDFDMKHLGPPALGTN